MTAAATIGAAVAGCVDHSSDEKTTDTTKASVEESYEPEDNEVPGVYGPPEDMVE